LNKAKELKADKIATGHYSIIEYDKNQKRWLLKRSMDEQKDQSYFLYTMTQKQLSKTLFPIGKMTKTKVRVIAKRLGLSVADKPDSQEVCFIPDKNYPKFLIEKYNQKPITGLILNTKGEVIGKHPGIIFYTIGQRRRIRIPMDKPLYVLKIDFENNNIIVGAENEGYGKKFIVDNLNFIGIKHLDKPIRVYAKIRYNYKPEPATIVPIGNKAQVVFDKEQWAITPGQAAVFYDNAIVVGGGIII
jgi:tRNA-specific 2-thiouridylase